MSVFLYLGIICFSLWLLIIIIKRFLGRNSHYILEKNLNKKPNIAILIPARNESLVIEDLLKSINNQTYKINPQNVYIIVESSKDPTIKIAKEYNMNIFIRKDFTIKTKGYAIDELLKSLAQKEEFYDLYFIFDADNILDKNYLKQMVYKYLEGYSLGMGYRALKNKDNMISVSAWLTFLLVNDYRNVNCQKHLSNILFSGTGFYINGRLIKEWKGFPFHSLTEDYELSIYATLNHLSTTYHKKAIFYDTSPIDYQTSIKQRSRWIKGYMLNWFKNIFKLFSNIFNNKVNREANFEFGLGIIPGVLLVLSIFSFLVYISKSFLLGLILLYLMVVLLTIILLRKTKISLKLFIKTCLYHPIFLLSYVHSFLLFIFKKDLGWDIIKH